VNLFLLSNLGYMETGVDGAIIWVSAGEFAESDAKLVPRLLVVAGNAISHEGLKNAVALGLTDPVDVRDHLPRQMREQAARFVVTNRDTLLDYWNGALSTRQMLDRLRRI
jgi:hypothetical protein